MKRGVGVEIQLALYPPSHIMRWHPPNGGVIPNLYKGTTQAHTRAAKTLKVRKKREEVVGHKDLQGPISMGI